MKNIIICVKDNNKESTELLPGYVKLESEYEKKNIHCWNCCHECSDIKYLPLKHNNGIFHVYGVFCSDGCSYRYLYDNYKNKDLWEKIQLIKFYHKEMYGEFINVMVPPSRLVLNIFGGSIGIDEYRNSENIQKSIISPPIIIVGNCDINTKTKEIDYLKLYRKKKAKNTILNSLQ